MRHVLFCAAALFSMSLLAGTRDLRAEEEKVPLDKLPKVVVEAVKKKFPGAELISATSEKEDKELHYEVTIKVKGKKIDVTVEEDGDIEGFEREIDLKDLPKAVLKALEEKYPKMKLKSAEAVYEIEDSKEELEYYEVLLITADKKEIEVKIEADGTFKEEETSDE